MLDKLIPWKRSNQENGNPLSVRHDNDPVDALRRDFDNVLSRLWDEAGLSRWDTHNWVAGAMEFDENEKEYVVSAELPGFEPEDIDVKVSGNVLTVRAEHTAESNSRHGRSHRYGSFYETFTLPSGAKADAIEARYRSGVLEVHVPKDESIPAKRIEVKAAA